MTGNDAKKFYALEPSPYLGITQQTCFRNHSSFIYIYISYFGDPFKPRHPQVLVSVHSSFQNAGEVENSRNAR